jgi:hypothetical protein
LFVSLFSSILICPFHLLVELFADADQACSPDILYNALIVSPVDEGSVEYFYWDVIKRGMDLLINQKLYYRLSH